MKEIVIATKNPDKEKELKKLLKGLRIKITSLEQYPDCPDVKEGNRSFRENAIRKAMAVSNITRKMALADDSGLEVGALKARPGVRSSRFAGEKANYAKNNQKLLTLLKDKKAGQRSAQFRCVVAICDYPKLIGVVEGKICGKISYVSRGRYGFGYDPVFVVPKYQKTFAELGPKIKNKISHRAQALNKAKKLIIKYFLNPRKPQ